MAVFNHIRARVDPSEAIDLKIVDEEEHEALVVKEVLQTLQRELVEVVVDAHHLDLLHGVVLEHLEHQLGVDEAAKVEDKVVKRDIKR